MPSRVPSAGEDSPPESDPPRGWLSGLVSGAGRILSTVFGSDDGEDESSEYTSDEDDQYRDVELIEDQVAGSQPLPSTNDMKNAIVQLLQKQTYSRDESNQLVEIIQSRVADLPTKNDNNGMHMKFQEGNRSGDIALTRLPWSSKQNYVTGRSPPTPIHLSSPYSSPLDQTHSREAAIMEAKNWLEEKNVSSISKFSPSFGPCTLNTDAFHQEIEEDVGSPVQVAKSYMQSLPPWRSPFVSSVGFRTPSSSSSLGHSSPYLEALKRSFSSGPSDVDASRNVRQKIGSMSWYCLDRSDSPSVAAIGEKHLLSMALDSAGVQTRNLMDSTDKETAKAFATDKILSSSDTGAAEPNNLTSEAHVHRESQTPYQDSVSHKKQVLDLGEASQVTEQLDVVTVADPSILECNGSIVEGILDAEPIAVLSGNTCAFSSMPDGIPNTTKPALLITSRKSSKSRQRRSKLLEDNSCSDTDVCYRKSCDVAASSRPGSLSKPEAADHSVGTSKMGDKRRIKTNGKFLSDDPRDTCKLSSGPSTDGFHEIGNKTTIDSAHLGTTIKSIKQMLRELPPSPGRGRGGKKVVSRGGRGKGRGK